MTVPTVTTVEAARLAHVTVKQLRSWSARGFVQPVRDGEALAWPVGEIDRAELLGVLGRALGEPDLWLSLAECIEAGKWHTVRDGDYEVVIAWRSRRG